MSFIVEGTLARQDVVRFQYADAYRHLWPGVLVLAAIAIIMPALEVIVWIDDRSALRTSNHGALGLLALTAFFFSNPWRAGRSMFSRSRHLREPIRYEFSDQGVTVVSSDSTSEVKWTFLHCIRETEHLFLLYQLPDITWILPKRYFTSPEQAAQWKAYAIAHLSNPNLFEKPQWFARWL